MAFGSVLVREQQAPGQRGRPALESLPREASSPEAWRELARQLPEELWRKVAWRESSRGEVSSRFAAVRVHSAEGDVHYKPPGPEEWLLCEWHQGEPRATTFRLSSLVDSTPRRTLVRLAKLRWRVERDYQTSSRRWG